MPILEHGVWERSKEGHVVWIGSVWGGHCTIPHGNSLEEMELATNVLLAIGCEGALRSQKCHNVSTSCTFLGQKQSGLSSCVRRKSRLARSAS